MIDENPNVDYVCIERIDVNKPFILSFKSNILNNTNQSKIIHYSIDYKLNINDSWSTKTGNVVWNYAPTNVKTLIFSIKSKEDKIYIKNFNTDGFDVSNEHNSINISVNDGLYQIYGNSESLNTNSINLDNINTPEIDDMTYSELLNQIEELKNEINTLKSQINQNKPVTYNVSYNISGDSLWESGQGAYSIQMKGSGAKALGNYSIAEGFLSYSIGSYSHTEGGIWWKEDIMKIGNELYTVAYGESSHAEGSGTYALGFSSHAEGICTYATNAESHAEGLFTYADGVAAHAEGINTYAIGFSSHAEGEYTYAYNDAEHAQGIYNKSNEGTISSIGIGTSNNRKNAFEVMNNGDIYIYGIGNYDGTNPNNSYNIQHIINKGNQITTIENFNNIIIDKYSLSIEDNYLGVNRFNEIESMLETNNPEHRIFRDDIEDVKNRISKLESPSYQQLISFFIPLNGTETILPEPIYNESTGIVNHYADRKTISFYINTNCKFNVNVEYKGNTNNYNQVTLINVKYNDEEISANKLSNTVFNETNQNNNIISFTFAIKNYDADDNTINIDTQTIISAACINDVAIKQTSFHIFKCWNNLAFIE